MTVEDLIEKLKQMPPTAIIVFQSQDDESSEYDEVNIDYAGGLVIMEIW